MRDICRNLRTRRRALEGVALSLPEAAAARRDPARRLKRKYLFLNDIFMSR